VVIALMGSMHERSYYDTATTGHDYNISTKHKKPLKVLTDALLPALAKPLYYYQVSGDGPVNCWKPRLVSAHNPFASSVIDQSNNRDRETWYRPEATANTRTLLSLLVESDYKKGDGILPILMKNTKVVGSLMPLLARMGDDSAAGGIYAGENGAREKLFAGLEQIFTAIKTDKGDVIDKQTTHPTGSYTMMSYPSWMFTKADTDIDLNVLLDEMIGYDGTPGDVWGKGLNAFVDHRTSGHPYYMGYDWNNFDKITAATGELMSTIGTTQGQYCVTEDVINLMDKLLSSFSAEPEELVGLRHTLAMLFVYHDGTDWQYPDELKQILTAKLPELLAKFGAVDGHEQCYNDILTMGGGLMKDNGFLEYMLSHLSTKYSTDEVLTQLDDLLAKQDASGKDFFLNPESSFYTQLFEMLYGFLRVMDPTVEKAAYLSYDEEVNPFYTYKGIKPPEKVAPSAYYGVDIYGALGELLSGNR
jgi:hypothetical protein